MSVLNVGKTLPKMVKTMDKKLISESVKLAREHGFLKACAYKMVKKEGYSPEMVEFTSCHLYCHDCCPDW